MAERLLTRALCRIKLLPVTHVLVDTWMLTVKPVYKLLNVSDDLKWTTNTHDTIFTHFQGISNNIYGFGRRIFLLLHFFTRPPIFLPVHIRFYPSKWRMDGFLHKAMRLTEEDDGITEVDYTKVAFKAKGYKLWMFNFPQPQRKTETSAHYQNNWQGFSSCMIWCTSVPLANQHSVVIIDSHFTLRTEQKRQQNVG